MKRKKKGVPTTQTAVNRRLGLACRGFLEIVTISNYNTLVIFRRERKKKNLIIWAFRAHCRVNHRILGLFPPSSYGAMSP